MKLSRASGCYIPGLVPVIKVVFSKASNLFFKASIFISKASVEKRVVSPPRSELVVVRQEEYEQPRQRNNGVMLGAIDALQRVFKPQTGMLAMLRGFGVDVIQANPVIKNRIMHVAMGNPYF
jgi:hypothetical protein